MSSRAQTLSIYGYTVDAIWHGPLDPYFEVVSIVDEDGDFCTTAFGPAVLSKIEEKLAELAHQQENS